MKGNILVVDDSSAIRMAMRFILEKEGFAVTEAVNGSDCIKKIQPDTNLIISDVNMPEMDGVEMLKRVRESGPYRTIPIIMLTTVSQEEMMQKGKDMGATAWLLKPFQPDKLIAIINKVIG
jgi:two-component system, chemotaxis family, chemotaxis protein CheY